jgi:uncharacterized protein YlaI
MEKCTTCNKELQKIDIGLSKKLINRGTTTYFCIECLAKKYNVTVELLREKAEHFKQMGCTLF